MRSKLFSIARTILLSLLLGFAMLCIMALLMWKLQLSAEQLQIGLMASYVLACLFGGFCLGHILPKARILWGIAFGIGYFLLLLLLSVTAAGHSVLFTADTLRILLLCIFGGACGAFFS